MIRVASSIFLFLLLQLIIVVETSSLSITSPPSLTLSHDNVKSWEEWIDVTAKIDDSEFERNVTEYICTQDSYCNEVKNLSVWIGLFDSNADLSPIGPQTWSCGNPPWLATSPIKWQPISRGSTTAKFLVKSHRRSLKFALFTNGTNYPIHLATSKIIESELAHLPRSLHLALGSSPNTMRVSFEARDLIRTASVRFGTTSGGPYENEVRAIPSTYGREDMCGPPANTYGFYEPPWFYSALLTNLTEGVRYYYVASCNGTSEERSFRGPPVANADAVLHITALADMGETYEDGSQYHWMEPYAINTTSGAIHPWDESYKNHNDLKRVTLNPAHGVLSESGKEGPPKGRTMKWISKSDVESDVLLHIGDLSYATGFESEWDIFMSQIEPIASSMPYMIAQGNHERDFPNSGSTFAGGDSGGECGIPTQYRFRMPTLSGRQDNGWYSFDMGPVHFLVMDTEMNAFESSTQYNFFKSDLENVDRSITPWVIFSGHRPMYSSSDGINGLDLANGPWWPEVEQLLLKYEVDLCLWGHVHNAEVTCPLRNGTCAETSSPNEYGGIVHAVIGNAGQSLSKFKQGGFDWSMWRFAEFGYSSIEVMGRKNLTMRFFADSNHSVVYEFTIQGKTHSNIDRTNSCSRCLIDNCCVADGLKCIDDGHDGACTKCTGEYESICGDKCCKAGQECHGDKQFGYGCTLPLGFVEKHDLRRSSRF